MDDVRLLCFNALLYNGENDPLKVYDRACRYYSAMWCNIRWLRTIIWQHLQQHEAELTEMEMKLNTYNTDHLRPINEMERDKRRVDEALGKQQPTVAHDSEELGEIF